MNPRCFYMYSKNVRALAPSLRSGGAKDMNPRCFYMYSKNVRALAPSLRSGGAKDINPRCFYMYSKNVRALAPSLRSGDVKDTNPRCFTYHIQHENMGPRSQGVLVTPTPHKGDYGTEGVNIRYRPPRRPVPQDPEISTKTRAARFCILYYTLPRNLAATTENGTSRGAPRNTKRTRAPSHTGSRRPKIPNTPGL